MILFSIPVGVVAVSQLRESRNRESVVVHGETQFADSGRK